MIVVSEETTCGGSFFMLDPRHYACGEMVARMTEEITFSDGCFYSGFPARSVRRGTTHAARGPRE